MPTTAPRPIPTTASTAEITASLLTVRFVSACSNSRLMLPNRSRNDFEDAGPVSSGWERMLASLACAVLGGRERLTPVSRSRRSSILLPGLSRSSRAAPPTRAATPTNASDRNQQADSTLQSSSMTRSRKALDGRRTPADSSRDMNAGRMPVAMNLP